jgi:hypothetical protein
MQRHTAEDLRHFQGLLEKIDAARTDGVFCGNLEARLLLPPAGVVRCTAVAAAAAAGANKAQGV